MNNKDLEKKLYNLTAALSAFLGLPYLIYCIAFETGYEQMPFGTNVVFSICAYLVVRRKKRKNDFPPGAPSRDALDSTLLMLFSYCFGSLSHAISEVSSHSIGLYLFSGLFVCLGTWAAIRS